MGLELLTAAMAFAVVMIIFSTIVTGITEAYLRFTHQRPNMLAKSLLRFVKENAEVQAAISAVVQRADAKIDASVDTIIAAAVARLASLSIPEPVKSELKALAQELGTTAYQELDPGTRARLDAALDKAHQPLKEKAEARLEAQLTVNSAKAGAVDAAAARKSKNKIDQLSTYSFLQRLAQSQIGKELARKLDDYAIKTLAMGFERYVALSNEIFRKRAQWVTFAISLIVALSLNINAIEIFKYLLQNPEIRAELIAEFEQSSDKLGEMATLGANTVALRSGDAVPAEGADNVFAQLETEISGLNEKVDLLQAQGLPIGYADFTRIYVGCSGEFSGAEACYIGKTIAALFGMLVGGVLIGLGGPFWYRVFSSLSHLAQVLRMVKGSPRKEAITDDMDEQQAASNALVTALSDPSKRAELINLFRAFAGAPERFRAETSGSFSRVDNPVPL